MPTIVFWNAARLATIVNGWGASTESAAAFSTNINAIAERVKPDLIVLCEALKGLRKSLNASQSVPKGYVTIKPGKQHGNYGPGKSGDPVHTLRYLIFSKQNLACEAFYVSTGDPRPAVLLRFSPTPGSLWRVLAIHAPSVTGSYVPQAQAVGKAVETMRIMVPPALLSQQDWMPHVVFGDFNVKGQDVTMVNKFRARINQHITQPPFLFDQSYACKTPLKPTHGKNTLDWALVRQDIAAQTLVENIVEGTDENSDNAYDDPEGDWMPPVISSAKSDHSGIVIKW